ncbi:MAG TPA: DUF5953 family protein [Myxococcaceae bacterium]|nr:DUF5953 family protein [Myxococcaceae bacterium]
MKAVSSPSATTTATIHSRRLARAGAPPVRAAERAAALRSSGPLDDGDPFESQGGPEPPRGLPALKLPWDIRSPEIPHRLGWLSYWSDAAARAIGFPDPARDAELLSRSRRTASGGWVVRLTDAPLDERLAQRPLISSR